VIYIIATGVCSVNTLFWGSKDLGAMCFGAALLVASFQSLSLLRFLSACVENLKILTEMASAVLQLAMAVCVHYHCSYVCPAHICSLHFVRSVCGAGR
jgi:hypothetical protein